MLRLRALLFVLLWLVTNILAARVPTIISCTNANMASGAPGRRSLRFRNDISTAHANNILHNIGSQSDGVYKASMKNGRLTIKPVHEAHGKIEVGNQMVSSSYLIKLTFASFMRSFKRCFRSLNAGLSLNSPPQSQASHGTVYILT